MLYFQLANAAKVERAQTQKMATFVSKFKAKTALKENVRVMEIH